MEATTKEVLQDRLVLRHRIKQLAEKQHALQKVLHDLPRWKAREHIELMEQHAIELSRLAAQLHREGHVFKRPWPG